MAVVLRKPADAGCHHFLRGARSVPPDGEPRETQMIPVAELRVGQGQAKEGVQEVIVGEHSISPFLVAASARHLQSSPEKEIDPAGSLRWLRRLPCG